MMRIAGIIALAHLLAACATPFDQLTPAERAAWDARNPDLAPRKAKAKAVGGRKRAGPAKTVPRPQAVPAPAAAPATPPHKKKRWWQRWRR